jgi:hypothetical protein
VSLSDQPLSLTRGLVVEVSVGCGGG